MKTSAPARWLGTVGLLGLGAALAACAPAYTTDRGRSLYSDGGGGGRAIAAGGAGGSSDAAGAGAPDVWHGGSTETDSSIGAAGEDVQISPPPPEDARADADGPRATGAEAGSEAGAGQGVDSAPPADGQLPMPRVALVVGDPQRPTAGDARLRARLQARGMVPVLIAAEAPASATEGAALVVICASGPSRLVTTKYRDASVPVIVLETSLYDDMQLTGVSRGSDFGDEDAASITILDGGHSLAAGLHGTVTVASAAGVLGWGRPGPAAWRIAGSAGSPSRVTLFAYERGATMVGMAAPGRRVAFFAGDVLAERLTEAGGRLLDAAVDWALR